MFDLGINRFFRDEFVIILVGGKMEKQGFSYIQQNSKKFEDEFEENKEFRRASCAFNKQKMDNLLDDSK